MRGLDTLVLLTGMVGVVRADSAAQQRPRGVGPEYAKFYTSSDTFTCIAHPSITLSRSQVNDDFCDCPDGSDEPGTAACTHLSHLSPPQPIVGSANTSMALPGFYCKNKGHMPGYVPSIYVNDGVCDYELCCDGSDEWAGVGGVKCPDRCKEIGKEWRKLDEVRQKSAHNALRSKEALVAEAAKQRAAVEMGITRLELEITTYEAKAVELKKAYEDIELRERGRVVKSSGKGSRTTILAGLAKARVEELRENLVGVLGKRDQLQEKVNQLEGILATFKEEYNPNFNDEGVKRAVHAWEDYAAGKEGEVAVVDETDFEAITKPDSETEGINWAEWEAEEEESDIEALYKFEAYLPNSVRIWVHTKLDDLRTMMVENGILAASSRSSSILDNKIVAQARDAWEQGEQEVRDRVTAIADLRKDLEGEYGEDDVFRGLKDKCVSVDSGEYTYEVCWLDKVAQKSKKGGGHTGLGTFTRFGTMEVDEEVGADGKGLGQGTRTYMQFDNGQGCWNGPNRQTTVVMACAEHDEIWKVRELEKCIYQIDAGTPAVCQKAERKKALGKDEL